MSTDLNNENDMDTADDLDRLLTLESALNVANQGAAQRDVTDRLERLHPGFHLLAGPYAVEVRCQGQRAAERGACLRVLADQRRAGHAVKLVMAGAVAYVLRDETGWVSQANGCRMDTIRSLTNPRRKGGGASQA